MQGLEHTFEEKKREHVARLALGRICFMLEARKMMIDEKEISLTKAEYDICEFLAKNRGQIFFKGTDIGKGVRLRQ